MGSDIRESVWFDTKKLYEYLDSHIVSITAQTKAVSLYSILSEEEKQGFINKNLSSLKRIKELEAECTASFDKEEIEKIKFKIEMVKAKKEAHVIDLQYELMAQHRIANHTKRTAFSRVSVPAKLSFGSDTLRSVHDMKDYGDTDELIYRDLFKCGAIRVELALPGKNGKLSKKIYYHIPKDEFVPEGEFDISVPVPYTHES